MKFIKYLPMILNFISHMVKEAEQMAASGEEKKKAVLSAAEELLKKLGIYDTGLMKFISFVIDALVFFYNLTGLFQHSKKEEQ